MRLLLSFTATWNEFCKLKSFAAFFARWCMSWMDGIQQRNFHRRLDRDMPEGCTYSREKSLKIDYHSHEANS